MFTNQGTAAQEALYALGLDEHPHGSATLDSLTDVRWIREHAERLVTQHVADLRAQGTTWQAIATALGVTVQAAHKRYAGETH